MTKLIVVGCPYTGMRDLRRVIEKSESIDRVVSCEEIWGVRSDHLILQDDEPVELKHVWGAFIRYPYDLIPPHSQSFCLREGTEFLKSVSLMLDSVALNPITKCWALRNRVFSLSSATQFGLRVPESIAVADGNAIPSDWTDLVVKALGNCFVSERDEDHTAHFREYLTFEQESDGDTAYVFLANLMNRSNAHKFINSVGASFVQVPIRTSTELRVYVIGDKFFEFRRDDTPRFDKSAIRYRSSKNHVSSKDRESIVKFTSSLGLGFLCLDVVFSENGDLFVIDINPYGSLPNYDENPAPTIALAGLLVGERE